MQRVGISLVGGNELAVGLYLFAIQQEPRVRQCVGGWRASDEEFQIFGRGVTAINKGRFDGQQLSMVDGVGSETSIWDTGMHKSTLTDHIIATSNLIGLFGQSGLPQKRSQRQRTIPRTPKSLSEWRSDNNDVHGRGYGLRRGLVVRS